VPPLAARSLWRSRHMQRDAGCAEPPCWKHQSQGVGAGIGGAMRAAGCTATGHDRQSCIPAIDDETMRGAIGAYGIACASEISGKSSARQGVSLISPARKFRRPTLRRQACLHQDFRKPRQPEAVFVMEAYQANRTRVFDNAAPWRLGEEQSGLSGNRIRPATLDKVLHPAWGLGH